MLEVAKGEKYHTAELEEQMMCAKEVTRYFWFT